jgi:starch synthase
MSLRVVMAGAEAFPYAKVGGLGDVLGALPKALAEEGADVTLILPRYRQVDAAKLGLERVPVPGDWTVGLHFVNHGFGLLRGKIPGSEANVLFLENDHFFDRWSVYNAEGGKPFPDDAERWLFYQKGVLETCKLLGLKPDVVHSHDSQAGLLGAYMRTTYREEPAFRGTGSVYTIHNIAYQGGYGPEALRTAGFTADWLHPGSPMETRGVFNWMKTGISFADVITTVSPTYAREIQTPESGVGLDPVLRSRGADVVGVLNGIDGEVWSPRLDARIARTYDVGDAEGKRANKLALLRRVGLPEADAGLPLLAFIGRLVPQKGCELLPAVLRDVLQHRVLFVGLGSGADEHEGELRALQAAFPDRARSVIGFDEELAHLMQAGADVLLMPSYYEPCGLNQMYAMTYGTVPVVRATGGLADTVHELPAGGTGFVFHAFTAEDFKEAVYRALAAYQDPPRWEAIVRNGMSRDFTWRTSARRYLELYERAIARARRQP